MAADKRGDTDDCDEDTDKRVDTVAADRDGDNDNRGDTVAADRRGVTDDNSEIEGDQGDIDSDGTTGAADNMGADEIDATALDASKKIKRTHIEQALTIGAERQ